ncbi:MAG: hypothetical protein JSV02_08650 [Dehalococcoidia bacterium]|nr:MAG: hypothetical protein JSV02_08650 [Dehalococcoidia bacterium]
MRPIEWKLTILSLVFLLCISLTSLIGCGSGGESTTAAMEASETGSRTFSDFNLSFQYPNNYLIWQDGLLDDDPGESSALVQVSPEHENLPLFAISWVRTWQYGLEGGLEAGFEGVENWEGIASISKDVVIKTTKSGHRMLYQKGHRMLYQYFTATTEAPNEIIYGIVGAFYCPETQRAFSLVTMRSAPDGDYKQSAVAEFESYIDSVTCHQ